MFSALFPLLQPLYECCALAGSKLILCVGADGCKASRNHCQRPKPRNPMKVPGVYLGNQWERRQIKQLLPLNMRVALPFKQQPRVGSCFLGPLSTGQPTCYCSLGCERSTTCLHLAQELRTTHHGTHHWTYCQVSGLCSTLLLLSETTR